MAGAGSNLTALLPATSIPAGQTWNLDLDLATIYKNLKLAMGVRYATLGSGSLTLTIFDGYGDADANAIISAVPYVFSTTGSTVPTFMSAGTLMNMTAPIAGQTIWTDLLLQSNRELDKIPRWIRAQYHNTDANPCTLTINGEF